VAPVDHRMAVTLVQSATRGNPLRTPHRTSCFKSPRKIKPTDADLATRAERDINRDALIGCGVAAPSRPQTNRKRWKEKVTLAKP
jgi:hypothetical protein